MPRLAYVGVAIALVAFGYLALFSIGFPFLLTGLLMLVLLAARARREVVVPTLVWPWVFTGAYVLVAPLGCTSTSSATPGDLLVEASTRCDGVFFSYAGGATYDPPLLPALLVGLLVATAAWIAIHRVMRRRSRTEPTASGPPTSS